MEVGEFINKNVSKKMGVALTTIGVLAYLNAHPAYIVAVTIVELIIQGYLDRKENKNELVHNSKAGVSNSEDP